MNYLPKYFPKEVQHQGTDVLNHSSTMLNQGTVRQKGCNLLSGSFFVSFLDKQKRKEKTEGHINVIKIKMGRE